MEHEIWFTAILNKLLGGVVTPLLAKIGHAPSDPLHPIPDYLAMEVLVILVVLVAAILLRRKLSLESPGKFQHAMEVFVEFTQNMVDENIGHEGHGYVPLLGTLGIFVLLCNLIGLIPTLQTPTARIEVTFGCAMSAFIYYNYHGIREHGIVGYLKHLAGPVLWMSILMFPIEVVSNVFRLLSLSVRLYANMFVGDVLEQVFTSLVPIGVPVVFSALHVFVSVLQAYIFMLLPAIYLSLAVAEEH